VKTVQDMEDHSVRQEAVIIACEARRKALVDTMTKAGAQ